MILSFGFKNLLNFVVDDIFLDFTEPEISGIDIPIVFSFLLFSGLEIAVGLEIHESDVFGFEHVDSGVNGLLGSILVLFSAETVLKFLVFGLFGQVIASING